MMKTAKATKAIVINNLWTAPEDKTEKWFQVHYEKTGKQSDWDAVKKYPEALLFEGEIYGRRGHNSDSGMISYCNKTLTAMPV